MRLSGFICIVAFAALVVTGGIVTWVDPGNGQSEPVGGLVGDTDLETRIGLQAAQNLKIGKPYSVHAPRAGSNPLKATPGQGARGGRLASSGPVLKIPSRSHPLVGIRQGAKVAIRAEPGGEMVEIVGHRTEFGSPTVFGVVRTAGQWLGVSTPSLPNHRLGWIRHDPERIQGGWTDHSIHVNLSARRATFRERGRDLFTFTVTVGAPDTRTPTGRFAVTDTFRGDLNPVYGCCAVAISAVQPHLRPGWPGGDRIALHGNGTGQALGLAVSNGCLRADDEVVSALVDEIDLGAPVFING